MLVGLKPMVHECHYASFATGQTAELKGKSEHSFSSFLKVIRDALRLEFSDSRFACCRTASYKALLLKKLGWLLCQHVDTHSM